MPGGKMKPLFAKIVGKAFPVSGITGIILSSSGPDGDNFSIEIERIDGENGAEIKSSSEDGMTGEKLSNAQWRILLGRISGLERSNNFQPDPEIKREDAAQLEDYKHSGWDRGHMAPSMDMNWNADVLDESYYLSNMCPQGHDFNSGIWLDLEHQIRYWAKRDSAICVVTGPILPKSKKDDYRKLPRSKVLIPDYFYKAVFAPFGKEPRAIAFVMPNEQRYEKISSFAISIDSLENLTGIDFFSVLPDDIEDVVEADFNLRDWFRKKDI